jgi:hypothetical protein
LGAAHTRGDVRKLDKRVELSLLCLHCFQAHAKFSGPGRLSEAEQPFRCRDALSTASQSSLVGGLLSPEDRGG